MSENIPRADSKVEEESFEDVGLEDAKPKKRGLFARFAETTPDTADENSRPGSSHRGFHIPGRKRGQSGQGAELGNMAVKVEEPKVAAEETSVPVL